MQIEEKISGTLLVLALQLVYMYNALDFLSCTFLCLIFYHNHNIPPDGHHSDLLPRARKKPPRRTRLVERLHQLRVRLSVFREVRGHKARGLWAGLGGGWVREEVDRCARAPAPRADAVRVVLCKWWEWGVAKTGQPSDTKQSITHVLSVACVSRWRRRPLRQLTRTPVRAFLEIGLDFSGTTRWNSQGTEPGI